MTAEVLHGDICQITLKNKTMSDPSFSTKYSTSSRIINPKSLSSIVENPLIQEEELEEFYEAFTRFKITEKGVDVIEMNDFPHFMRLLGQCPTEAEMLQMLREVGCLASEGVTFDQAVQILIRHFKSPHTTEELTRAFRVFDSNGNGMLGTEEIMSVINNLGEVYQEEDVREMVAELDKDRDGRIRADDFIALMGVPEMQKYPGIDRSNYKIF